MAIGELGTAPPNPSNKMGRLGLAIGAIEVADPPSFSACGTLMDLPIRSVLKIHHTKETVLFDSPVMGAHPEFRRGILYLVTDRQSATLC